MAAVFFYLGLTASAVAQANVRESAPMGTGISPSIVRSGQPVSDPAAVSSTSLSNTSPPKNIVGSNNLAYQIQQLQQELLELRGLLEEQGFELRRLKQQRLDDYLDLDKRLSELKQGPQPNKSVSVGVSDQTKPPTPKISDKDLYRKAMDQLLNQKNYPNAQALFGQYLTQFPNGGYVANVYYWQGQIYLTENNQSAAEKSFEALLDYPEHQKSFDAKYKLATIYFDQGKRTEAKVLLDQVAASESDSSRLAKAFLANEYK